MRILLADSHGPIFGKPQGTPNLGLLYLASHARERFPHAEFKYLPQRVSLEEHLAEITAFNPDLYALSFTSYGMAAAFELVERVKESNPALPIVVGGPHVSALQNRLPSIAGIAYRDPLNEGKPSRTAHRPMIEDMDSIPVPARDLVRA
ncbi:MAG: cobalamin-dependent protein [Myxococcota bacterium]